MDNLLSQARPAYLEALLMFRRVLRQRNRLLGKYQEQRNGPPPALIAPWDEELIRYGSRLIAIRSSFAARFSDFLDTAYKEIESVAERPTLRYDSIARLSGGDEADIATVYRQTIEVEAQNERRRGLTLVGPHRDELVFRLNDLLVRRYASQGQHRTFGMAMKLAKYFYLRDYTGEYPLLLLDDVFDHLDRRRSTAFLQLLQSDKIGQTLITATDRTGFLESVAFDEASNRSLYVEAGEVCSVPEEEQPSRRLAAKQGSRS
jgi:DNA replication and repair protein RecF